MKPFAIGLGARAGIGASEAARFVRDTAQAAGVALEDVAALVTLEKFRAEAGLAEAAAALGLDLVFLTPDRLQAQQGVVTSSARVAALYEVGSVAEAAALAGAGPGATLLAPRAATARLTCAIARAKDKAP